MPFNGTGTFTTLSYPNYPAQPGTTIRASQFNNNIQDLVNGLTNCLTRDGQSPPTSDLPMGGMKHTGVGLATTSSHYARYDQVLDPAVGGTISVNSVNPALRLTQAGTGNVLVVEDAASDTTPFVVDASGAVGVAGQPPLIQGFLRPFYVGSGNTGGATAVVQRSTADASPAELFLCKTRGTTPGSKTIVNNNDGAGTISFIGADGVTDLTLAQISAAVDGTPGANDMPGRLLFYTTADGASTPTERMRIDSNGRSQFTGGGVTGEVVRVASAVTDSYLIINQSDPSTTNTNRPVLSLRKNNAAALQVSCDGAAANLGVTYYEAFTATGAHAFLTNSVERMRIEPTGTINVSKNAKGTVTTANTLAIDMALSNNFLATPTGSATLTFSNITAGQSGNILLNNTTNYTISKAAAVKASASFLTTVSATGLYYISYYSPDGTNVYVSATGALS